MSKQYVDAILKFLADRDYRPVKPRQLARQIGIAESEYGGFREAVKQLRDAGRVVLGSGNALTLPEIGNRLVGTFRANPRGFGFVIPESPNSHGDLFIGADDVNGAMTGDVVVAKVRPKGKRDGEMKYDGVIVEIVERAQNRFVGTLQKSDRVHFVMPEGRKFTQPIVIRDVGAAGPPIGKKVVVEIVTYGGDGKLPAGVIVEELGKPGRLEVETRAVILAHGLAEEFSKEAMAYARKRIRQFDPNQATDHERENLTGRTICTIDPPDARDYDDAIELTRTKDGLWQLGVHIADVSYFVEPDSPLDVEAKARSTSTYFPRRVLPMLPEILSNGVCSLQEGQKRYVQSAYILYDDDGEVRGTRLSEGVINSAARLTYQQAQDIIDGKSKGPNAKVAKLVRNMNTLARAIEARRRRAGMLHLDLPAVELVLDKQGKVADAVPEDDAYTHTIIEMFMVEANEAVARTLTNAKRNFLRRIHPQPEPQSGKQLKSFINAAGHKLPTDLTREDIQRVLEAVKGRPESFAVNLAILKTFQQAEYSPMKIGHFALASDCYCHFTSPIRRYPDLTVHRLVRDLVRGKLDGVPPEDITELVTLGDHCTTAERRSEAAESELRQVLILQLLETKIGETFNGVITGVTNFGVFVQWPQYLVDGLVRLEDLGDDWWEVQAKTGQIRGERTGKTFRIGDTLQVQVLAVDVARRQLDLMPTRAGSKSDAGKRKKTNDAKKTSNRRTKAGRGKGKVPTKQAMQKRKAASSPRAARQKKRK